MRYVNARALLPDSLVKELQRYIQGGYLYVPAEENHRRSWGEVSGYKQELQLRNTEIIRKYKTGSSVQLLAEEYCLSVCAIRKIIGRR